MTLNLDKVKSSVVRVGDGRGFVIEGADDRFIVTAAHCLGTSVVPCASFSFLEERTYQSLVAKIGETPTVSAECFFIDPIADIAVLGPPDSQTLGKQHDAWEILVDEAVPLSVSEAPEQGPAWLLSLDGRWFHCDVWRHPSPHGPLWISKAVEGIAGGMSGSPILGNDGSAIGVVCTGHGDDDASTEGGPAPRLAAHLPGWLLQEVGLARLRPRAKWQKKRAAAREGQRFRSPND